MMILYLHVLASCAGRAPPYKSSKELQLDFLYILLWNTNLMRIVLSEKTQGISTQANDFLRVHAFFVIYALRFVVW